MRSTHVGPACAVVGGALGSIVPTWARLPIVLYDPIARSVRVARIGAPGAGKIEMTYYGVYLVALTGALLGGLIGAAVDRRGARSGLASAWAMTALFIAAAYQVWTLWPA